MRMLWLTALMATPLIGACGDDGDTQTDTAQPQDTAAETSDTATPDTSAPDTSTPDTIADDTATPDTLADDTATPDTVADDTTEETTEEVTPVAVTWDDVYPIFAASCSPCHASGSATGGSGGHSIASPDKAIAYQASQRDANIDKCSGLKVGECALLRIQDGSMPATGDCREPKTDKCPDTGEQELIQRWIDQGMRER